MAVLSISREFGSGGEEIGRELAERLGYDFVDKERIHQDMKSAGERWERLSRDIDEARPSIWERFDWEYRGFVALIGSAILDYALRDRVVIVGRGGTLLLQGIPFVLRVRFIAPKESRVEWIMDREGLDRESAIGLVERIDRDRASYILVNYGAHWDDPRYYDMILNTAVHSREQTVKILSDALLERDERATPEARKALEDRALAARIKAKILTDSRLFIPTLEVTHDGTAIVLKGVIHSQKEYGLAEEMAREISRPIPVRNELRYRKRWMERIKKRP